MRHEKLQPRDEAILCAVRHHSCATAATSARSMLCIRIATTPCDELCERRCVRVAGGWEPCLVHLFTNELPVTADTIAGHMRPSFE